MKVNREILIAAHRTALALVCALVSGIAVIAAILQNTGLWFGTLLFLAATLLCWRGKNASSFTIGERPFCLLFMVAAVSTAAQQAPRFVGADYRQYLFLLLAATGMLGFACLLQFVEELYYVFLVVNYGWSMKPRKNDNSRTKQR